MYKFNFLSKINKEKLEEKKRNRFIKMVFISSTSCLVLMLIILFLLYLNIGSSFNDAQDFQRHMIVKSDSLRNKTDSLLQPVFFKYKNIESVYNVVLKKRSATSVLRAVESALDSTLIINYFSINDNNLQLKFISRSSDSKSEIMSRMNNLKSEINTNLLELNLIDEKKMLSLLKGPDVKKSYDEFQYWGFDFEGEFKKYTSAKNNIKK